MSAPLLFGFPVWWGSIKGRVAKKYLNRWSIRFFLRRGVAERFARLGLGDFINECSGFNGKILKMRPSYVHVGRAGQVLFDIDFQTTNTGCSLISCGIEPKLPREAIETRHAGHLREWTLAEPGQVWFGESDEGRKASERARQMLAALESGGHICDEDGQLLSEFQRR